MTEIERITVAAVGSPYNKIHVISEKGNGDPICGTRAKMFGRHLFGDYEITKDSYLINAFHNLDYCSKCVRLIKHD